MVPTWLLAVMTVAAAPPVTVEARGAGVTVRAGALVGRADFSRPLEAEVGLRGLFLFHVDAAVVREVVWQGKDAWVLIEVRGPSRSPKMAAHQCGAGAEGALVLFHLAPQGPHHEVVSTESCWLTVEQRPARDGEVARLQAVVTPDGGGDPQLVELGVQFDRLQPQRGLVLVP